MRRERTAWQSWLRANMKLRFRPKAFRPKKENVVLAAGASLTFNAELSLLPSAPQAQPQTPANNSPNAPPGNQAPSLGGLRLSRADPNSNPMAQARLDR